MDVSERERAAADAEAVGGGAFVVMDQWINDAAQSCRLPLVRMAAR
jgi:hypothetical protein